MGLSTFDDRHTYSEAPCEACHATAPPPEYAGPCVLRDLPIPHPPRVRHACQLQDTWRRQIRGAVAGPVVDGRADVPVKVLTISVVRAPGNAAGLVVITTPGLSGTLPFDLAGIACATPATVLHAIAVACEAAPPACPRCGAPVIPNADTWRCTACKAVGG